ncbi:MAG TPA: hypothetical protein VHB98_04885, partial [Chloroflexota bacterium]|nr:hypothetical protein [Chloroflexota bacterium]
FTEWGVRLTASCVAGYCLPATNIRAYVNGKAYHRDPAAIPLTGYQEIAIVIGSPPRHIPSSADWSNIL